MSSNMDFIYGYGGIFKPQLPLVCKEKQHENLKPDSTSIPLMMFPPDIRENIYKQAIVSVREDSDENCERRFQPRDVKWCHRTHISLELAKDELLRDYFLIDPVDWVFKKHAVTTSDMSAGEHEVSKPLYLPVSEFEIVDIINFGNALDRSEAELYKRIFYNTKVLDIRWWSNAMPMDKGLDKIIDNEWLFFKCTRREDLLRIQHLSITTHFFNKSSAEMAFKLIARRMKLKTLTISIAAYLWWFEELIGPSSDFFYIRSVAKTPIDLVRDIDVSESFNLDLRPVGGDLEYLTIPLDTAKEVFDSVSEWLNGRLWKMMLPDSLRRENGKFAENESFGLWKLIGEEGPEKCEGYLSKRRAMVKLE